MHEITIDWVVGHTSFLILATVADTSSRTWTGVNFGFVSACSRANINSSIKGSVTVAFSLFVHCAPLGVFSNK